MILILAIIALGALAVGGALGYFFPQLGGQRSFFIALAIFFGVCLLLGIVLLNIQFRRIAYP
jgi:hypothetical protein